MGRAKRKPVVVKGSSGHNSGGRGLENGLNQSFIAGSGQSIKRTKLVASNFSLQEEARNTGRQMLFWSSDLKLRHNKVNFVSGGDYDANELIENRRNEASLPVEDSNITAGVLLESQTAFADLSLEQVGPADLPRNEEEFIHDQDDPGVSTLPFALDMLGDKSLVPPEQTFLGPLRDESPSPTLSDSSAEVILFTGRNKRVSLLKQTSPTRHTVKQTARDSDDSRPDSIIDTPKDSSWIETKNYQHLSSTTETQSETTFPGEWPLGSDAQTAAALDDYVANLKSSGHFDELSGNGLLNVVGLGSPVVSEQEPPSTKEEDSNRETGERDNWSRSDLEDLRGLSTSSTIMENVQTILSKRERKHGIQYLVLWEGHVVDDARWIPAELLKGKADGLISLFDERECLEAKYRISKGKNESESSGEESDSSEDRKDNKDLLQRKLERLGDEKLARLLSKQEQMGLGSADLMITDDDSGDDLDTWLDSPKAKSKFKGSGKDLKHQDKGFPSPSRFVDVYDSLDQLDDFDIVDRDRPSLQRKSKRNKGVPSFDTSDLELQYNLSQTWVKDRAKKKARKEERQSLRDQGLLGRKHKGKRELPSNFSGGVFVEDIKVRVRDFLLSEDQSLSLPPMKTQSRIIVHNIANLFNLTSKSVGPPNSRAPTLSKTSKTRPFNESALQNITPQLPHWRARKSMEKGGGKGPLRTKATGAGGSAAMYRDGEVVGAAAPELGQENRGRAMLEKMGWTHGVALGALNNKGILHPVSHVVKTTKAGLG